FSPGGEVLATAAGSAVRLWDYRSGREIHPDGMPTVPADRLWFSEDGTALYSFARDNRLFTWDVRSSHLVQRTTYPTRFDSIVFDRAVNRAALWEWDQPEIWI